MDVPASIPAGGSSEDGATPVMPEKKSPTDAWRRVDAVRDRPIVSGLMEKAAAAAAISCSRRRGNARRIIASAFDRPPAMTIGVLVRLSILSAFAFHLSPFTRRDGRWRRVLLGYEFSFRSIVCTMKFEYLVTLTPFSFPAAAVQVGKVGKILWYVTRDYRDP